MMRNAPSVVTKQDGRFSFPAQKDKYIIIVVHKDGYARINDSEFEASSKIVLQPYSIINGKFLIKNKLKEPQTILLHYGKIEDEINNIRISQDYRANTDEEGNFVFNNVPPGPTRMYWEIRNDLQISLSHGLTLDIKAGQTNNVSIGGTGRPVVGKILIPDYLNNKLDLQYTSRILAIKSKENPYTQLAYTVEKDYSFRIEDVPAGDYSLLFY